MWLDIVDKSRLINLDYVESVALEHEPEHDQWRLVTVSHSGTLQLISIYKDYNEANRALDRVRHALQTIVLTSDRARGPE
jgi:hypothetical protein